MTIASTIRTLLAAALAALLPAAASAQHSETIDIEGVEIVGHRPLKQIGIQSTKMDSLVLKESISLSVADILTQNTPVFIKSYGRGSMATASMRGTAPSHTKVTWNGMSLNSPMLGMVDFSYIPAYLVDDAELYHGAGSVGVSGGGLGGAVTLSTRPADEHGLSLRYVQGIGSFSTYDEFLRASYGNDRWKASTRILYSSSDNDFRYTNYHKIKQPVYDAEGNVVGSRYVEDRNRSADFADFHILQEAYHNTRSGHRIGLAAWYMSSHRGIPKISADYRDDSSTRTRQNENTLRAVVSWEKISGSFKAGARAGYTYTDMLYTYSYDLTGTGEQMREGIHSQSYVNSLFAKADIEYALSDKWLFTADIALNQHFVQSIDRSVIVQDGSSAVIGYKEARAEVSAYASIRYKPTERIGLAACVRDDMYGDSFTPPVPALYVDALLSKRGELTLKGSVTRNYRYPTLNDLYFMPGGNPDLRPEKGISYDAGLSTHVRRQRLDFSAAATWFDSYIDDWILWRATPKGFWTPLNIKQVHSYGIELRASLSVTWSQDWSLKASGLYTVTHAVNHGDPVSVNDASIGKQLPYIPVYSASATVRLDWRKWSIVYKWNHYSERHTTSSNDLRISDSVQPYYMSDLSLERRIATRPLDLSLRFDIRNLLDEEYETVLSHPMPRMNFGFYIGITPKFRNAAAGRY